MNREKPEQSQHGNNEPELFNRLLGQRQHFLVFLLARLSDPTLAEDLLQAAYLKLLTHASTLRDPGRAEAWFYRVLRNLVADAYRAQAARPEVGGEDALSASLAPPNSRPNLCPCMTRELSALHPGYATALRAVDLEEQPVAHYARSAGISAGNASVRLHRARRALRARLESVCQSCAGRGCLDCTCA
jgi:RNA polymerase sigma-70 factor (ECF subfamily)